MRIKGVLKFLWLLPFLFCSTTEENNQVVISSEKISQLIKDKVLLQEIQFLENKIKIEGLSSIDELVFNWKDTTLLGYLRVKNNFSEAFEKLKNQKVRDSVLAEHLFTISPREQVSTWKVALDPGHLARDLSTAKFEDKFIEFDNSTISFFEAKLTFFTALFIKEELEKKDVEVMLTHKYGEGAYKTPFDEWYKENFQSSLDSMVAVKSIEDNVGKWLMKLYQGNSEYGKKVIFHRLYKQIDLRKRAQIINEYKPDLTLVIHYNVDAENDDWKKPSDKNYNMAFVPGAFMEGEIKHPIDRLQLLRLLISNDYEKSVKLSSMVMKEMVERTGVDVPKDTTAEKYLTLYTQPTKGKGVYARNLSMTRLIEGVVCYGETLYQDNLKESVELSENDCEINGEKISCRVQQVGQAYASAILNYIKENPK